MKTEEQRKSEMHAMAIYLSVVMGILVSYFIGTVASVGHEYGLSGIETVIEAFNRFSNLQFLPYFNIGFIKGGILGLVSIPLFYLALSNDNQRNYTYKLDEVAGTGGFMSEKEKK